MNARKTVKQATKNLKPIKDVVISAFEIEFPETSGEYHIFNIAHNKIYITVGSLCNTGLNPHFWIEKDDTFSLDEQLEALWELIVESLYSGEELDGLIEL